MIAFATGYERTSPRVIPLRWPPKVTLVTGCDEERIDAVVDRWNRMQELIIFTRQGAAGEPAPRS